MSLPTMLSFAYDGATATLEISVPPVETLRNPDDGSLRKGIVHGAPPFETTMTLAELAKRNPNLYAQLCSVFDAFDAEVRNKVDEEIADPEKLRVQAIKNQRDKRSIEKMQKQLLDESERLAKLEAKIKTADAAKTET